MGPLRALLPPTASDIEIAWIIGAGLGLILTAICLFVMIQAAWTVVKLVRAGVLSWHGPRWSYALGMVVATGLFLPGWIAFLGIGLIAAGLPSNPNTPPLLSNAFGWIILLGETCFAAGQATIAIVWFRVKAVTMTSPNWAPKPDYPDSRRTPHA